MQYHSYVAQLFAQEQISRYEMFLQACQTMLLSMQAAGQKPTPKAIKKIEEKFYNRSHDLAMWIDSSMYDKLSEMFKEFEDEEAVQRLVGSTCAEATQALQSALSANLGTLISAARFGSAFGGFSYLLKDMHGEMGHIVQQKAQEMKWNVRTADGKTMSCLRYMYNYLRHFAYCASVVDYLLFAKRIGIDVVVCDPEDKVLASGKPEKFLEEETFKKYFHMNSENCVAFQS